MIDDLLYFGYNPRCNRSGYQPHIFDTCSSRNISVVVDEAKKEGVKAFNKSINKEIESKGGKNNTHVVPLSAGLDSRAILAALQHHNDVPNDSIITVTFGVPSTWDYEIGQQIAEAVGVENISINLSNSDIDWSEPALRSHTRKIKSPTRILESYINSFATDVVDGSSVIWSGYLGDPSAGSHLPESPSSSWGEARRYFVEKNQYAPDLAPAEYDPTLALPDKPYLPKERLSYEEQLDFAHRQQCMIYPIVDSKSSPFLSPFSRKEWLNFSLNLPPQMRKNRSLFVRIMIEMYPDIFKLPTDANNGLPINANMTSLMFKNLKYKSMEKIGSFLGNNYIDPNTNYLDFNSRLRMNGELSSTIKSLVEDFDDRGTYEVSHLWRQHQEGLNYATELRAVASAELYLSEVF